MTASDIEKRVIQIVAVTTGTSEAGVTRDTRFSVDVSIDSLDAVEMVMGLEDEYGIKIPDGVFEKWQNVGDALDWLVKELEIPNA